MSVYQLRFVSNIILNLFSSSCWQRYRSICRGQVVAEIYELHVCQLCERVAFGRQLKFFFCDARQELFSTCRYCDNNFEWFAYCSFCLGLHDAVYTYELLMWLEMGELIY